MTRHVVFRTDEIPDGEQRLAVVEGRTICVFNQGGEFFALLDRCPHEGGSLCRGARIGLVQSKEPGIYEYSRRGEMVKCPWHAWEFDIRTGQSWVDPKRIRVKTYEANVEAGEDLVKGPYVAETFQVSVETDYVVIEL
ncbi:3-phenylpropionate/trans-cinnamate dioxygenase ferredoxin subunit [Rhodoligotrophos appendicifer]|uniref:Rieske (2Fe-2S) protein n=1 Tax=Rhodoligotrophos appendicifer TaxID=987056 RepID=UPI001187047F|nr:Rieske (2Fe-2S) protein [Rhodoligotrophos appendicifer]